VIEEDLSQHQVMIRREFPAGCNQGSKLIPEFGPSYGHVMGSLRSCVSILHVPPALNNRQQAPQRGQEGNIYIL
jgi:hypothetical protein